MSTQPQPDSLDAVELLMAVEEAIGQDTSLSPARREQLISEIKARIERGEFGGLDDSDDDALAILVKKLGPRDPGGQSSAHAQPEEPLE